MKHLQENFNIQQVVVESTFAVNLPPATYPRDVSLRYFKVIETLRGMSAMLKGLCVKLKCNLVLVIMPLCAKGL
jgi:hypothetical protein